MVCPGVVRKAAKLVPTVLQALAFVVCIHVVGQVVFFGSQINQNIRIQQKIILQMIVGNVSSIWPSQVQVQ